MNESLIQRVPLFASLTPDEIHSLANTLHQLELAEDTILFREGEPGQCFYIILEGELEVIKAMGLPGERLLNIRGPGEFLGEMSLFEPGGLRTASVYARTPVKVLEMTHQDFLELLRRHPATAVEALRSLSTILSATDNIMVRELLEKNLQLERAYEELKAAQAQIIEKEKLERELQLARKIQESMLPHTLPSLAGFDFCARIVPARAVGGDLFDFIPLDSHSIGVLVGDVTDKGVPAALFMALTRSLFRAEASRNRSPRKVLQRVNSLLLDMNQASYFVTVLYGILNGETSEFTYARAGHELPLIFDSQGAMSFPGFMAGQPLGIFNNPAIDEQSILIPPGGLLLLYTDGVSDAVDPQGNYFSMDKLVSAIQSCIPAPSNTICDRFLEAILVHQDSRPQMDDITLVVLKNEAAK